MSPKQTRSKTKFVLIKNKEWLYAIVPLFRGAKMSPILAPFSLSLSLSPPAPAPAPVPVSRMCEGRGVTTGPVVVERKYELCEIC